MPHRPKLCPGCGVDLRLRNHVINERVVAGGIERIRACNNCGFQYTSFEPRPGRATA